jgi:hypothetical protein
MFGSGRKDKEKKKESSDIMTSSTGAIGGSLGAGSASAAGSVSSAGSAAFQSSVKDKKKEKEKEKKELKPKLKLKKSKAGEAETENGKGKSKDPGPGTCIIKLITVVIYGFRNKLECLNLKTRLGWKGLPGTITLAYYGNRKLWP